MLATPPVIEAELPPVFEWTSPDLSTAEKPKVIHFLYHFPCRDGFGAAWAFYRGLVENPPAKPVKVIFTPENHRFERVKALLESKTLQYETVICMDICPPRAMNIELYETAKLFRVLDHHKSAMDECGDLEWCYFDMNRSGAGIAWDTFNKAKRPFLIDCIEAGDLWRWETVPGSTEIAIYMEVNVRFKFEQYDALHKLLEDPARRAEAIKEGGYYHKYRGVVTQSLTGRKVHKLKIKGVTMPAVNCPIWQSGVGNVLVKKIGPCAAVYYFNGTYFAFSLRSDDDGPDVSKIAEKLGGGGHRNAAGFRVDDLADLASCGITFESYSEDELDEIEALLSPTQVDSPQLTTIVFGDTSVN